MNRSIKTLLAAAQADPATLCVLLTNGIELERIQQQIAESLHDENKAFDSQIRIQQAERFLCLLRNYTVLN